MATGRTRATLRARVSEFTGATIGVTKTEGEGTRLQPSAATSDEMVRIEDLLLASGLAYALVKEPYWAGRGYTAESLVSSAHGGADRRPSAESSSTRCCAGLRPRGAHVVKMARTAASYVASVALQGGLTAAEASNCLSRRSSPLIAGVPPVGTEPELASGQPPR